MAEVLLAEVFPGATQTSTSVTIPKAALPTLTAMGDNRAEQLIAAMVIRLAEVFTEAAREADPDRSIVVEKGSPRIDRRFGPGNQPVNSLVRELAVQFHEPYAEPDWDADRY